MLKSKKTQARLRLVVDNDRKSDGGYKSGRSLEREMPDTASAVSTRSDGTRPRRRHFWTAWYETPHFEAKGCSPPPPSIASSTGFMTRNLQLRVAIRQQPRGAMLFSTIQPMVETPEIERERFRKALNDRVAKDHPDVRGRPVWLFDEIQAYVKRTGRKRVAVSKQTCAYWLAGTKIARHGNASLLMGALGMTRGELFGEAEDPRLNAIVERWAELPEHLKTAMHSMVSPAPAQLTIAPQAPELAPARAARR